MKIIDTTFSKSEIDALKSLIGTKIHSIYHDPFQFTNSSSQVVEVCAESRTVFIYSKFEPQDYYGETEDVSKLEVSTVKYPIVDKKNFIETPVEDILKGIDMVIDNQKLYKDGEQIYDVAFVRGLILNFDKFQISFEKDVWLSDEIIIQRGYNLINKFLSVDDFIESDWDPGITAKCTRNKINL